MKLLILFTMLIMTGNCQKASYKQVVKPVCECTFDKTKRLHYPVYDNHGFFNRNNILTTVLMNPQGDSMVTGLGSTGTMLYHGNYYGEEKFKYDFGQECIVSGLFLLVPVGLVGTDSLIVRLDVDTVYGDYTQDNYKEIHCIVGNLVLVSCNWFNKNIEESEQNARNKIAADKKAKEDAIIEQLRENELKQKVARLIH